MAGPVADLLFREPPEDWTIEQFDDYIDRIKVMYLNVAFYLNLGEAKSYFEQAEALFERAWSFIDARIARFGETGVEYLHG